MDRLHVPLPETDRDCGEGAAQTRLVFHALPLFLSTRIEPSYRSPPSKLNDWEDQPTGQVKRQGRCASPSSRARDGRGEPHLPEASPP
jgi:hypothetical protein